MGFRRFRRWRLNLHLVNSAKNPSAHDLSPDFWSSAGRSARRHALHCRVFLSCRKATVLETPLDPRRSRPQLRSHPTEALPAKTVSLGWVRMVRGSDCDPLSRHLNLDSRYRLIRSGHLCWAVTFSNRDHGNSYDRRVRDRDFPLAKYRMARYTRAIGIQPSDTPTSGPRHS